MLCLFFVYGTHFSFCQEQIDLIKIKGLVLDEDTRTPLVSANLFVSDSNISTITNNDGKFILKIPKSYKNNFLVISHLGYEKKEIEISTLKDKTKIKLTPSVTQLNTVSILAFPEKAKDLVIKTLSKKSLIYNNNNTLMTAFYRETIKKRGKNASLSEAVLRIHKQPYNSYRKDNIELIKARKKTNYSRLDTLALKLQGGPFSNLYTDVIKYPEYIFTPEYIDKYDFSYGASTSINRKMVYVVNFKQKKNIKTPMYYGKLYIDAETLALTNAVYSLNVQNKELSSRMFVRKKPRKVKVYPLKATYKVNYRIQNDKWHYVYSNILLSFKVNWKGKLFNNTYTLNSEIAITDWKVHNAKFVKNRTMMLRPSTILAEQVSGFSDPEFWGEYNIIEPEKSIESAIAKIRKQLKKNSLKAL